MDRTTLAGDLFPEGIPRLWCPTVTHFSAAGIPDARRIGLHLDSIAAEVRGLLVPGSTGEGWSMSDDDIFRLLSAVLDSSARNGQRLLIGVLKTRTEDVAACMEASVRFLMDRTGAASWRDAFARSGVVGFTVCPPTGAELSQERIRSDLSRILSLGYPTALYQLPQVTGNEMSPETAAALAAEHPNFYLFKDTSGRDAVAASGLDLGGVFLVRGAEGAYASWPKFSGGPYDGFLLSTANGFSAQLGRILRLGAAGDAEGAGKLSAALEGAVADLFALVGPFPAGNAFANAAKLADHLRAWGAEAEKRPMPLLYGGERLPAGWVSAGRAILDRHGIDLGPPYLS